MKLIAGRAPTLDGNNLLRDEEEIRVFQPEEQTELFHHARCGSKDNLESYSPYILVATQDNGIDITQNPVIMKALSVPQYPRGQNSVFSLKPYLLSQYIKSKILVDYYYLKTEDGTKYLVKDSTRQHLVNWIPLLDEPSWYWAGDLVPDENDNLVWVSRGKTVDEVLPDYRSNSVSFLLQTFSSLEIANGNATIINMEGFFQRSVINTVNILCIGKDYHYIFVNAKEAFKDSSVTSVDFDKRVNSIVTDSDSYRHTLIFSNGTSMFENSTITTATCCPPFYSVDIDYRVSEHQMATITRAMNCKRQYFGCQNLTEIRPDSRYFMTQKTENGNPVFDEDGYPVLEISSRKQIAVFTSQFENSSVRMSFSGYLYLVTRTGENRAFANTPIDADYSNQQLLIITRDSSRQCLVPQETFYNCSSLRHVGVERPNGYNNATNNIIVLEPRAFYNCISLREIYISTPGGMWGTEQWKQDSNSNSYYYLDSNGISKSYYDCSVYLGESCFENCAALSTIHRIFRTDTSARFALKDCSSLSGSVIAVLNHKDWRECFAWSGITQLVIVGNDYSGYTSSAKIQNMALGCQLDFILFKDYNKVNIIKGKNNKYYPEETVAQIITGNPSVPVFWYRYVSGNYYLYRWFVVDGVVQTSGNLPSGESVNCGLLSEYSSTFTNPEVFYSLFRIAG